MFLASPRRLRSSGIIGMNQRNFGLIARYNQRRLYPLVDDKLKTKLLAQKAGISVPELLGTLRCQHDVKQLKRLLDTHNQFVIKPVKGSGGKGILVITKHDHNLYFKPSGDALKLADIERHVSNILSGLHSLGGKPDMVMIESLIQLDPVFANYSHQGIPDLRVIILKGYPIMAMLRLTTHASDGRANLHQGAVGVGIDIRTGKALHAVQFGKPITHHPDTRRTFSELAIPHWDRLLPLAAACYEMTGLGYLGVDIVLDKNLGPMIIELNARPGLSIQVANSAGLAPRVAVIEAIENMEFTPEQRVRFSQKTFSESFEAPSSHL
ncbi:alpha-L-glutamate ligase-related protein [Nitrosomonas cryotolerans]|uniref:Alpha-L-glutamate ligase-related protein n=2 Tax=Nitrosomonas cryotolerans TaxID=44575 RepID=A0A1N6HDZ4_9PROT|nr:alpha-L-glutamate ligase-related protein [Nitrosomonas cryotolerans]SIO17927.1 alpha-L-glutamate ligase-related protein [Nitrosomonas cryotolerans ATCC 49181]